MAQRRDRPCGGQQLIEGMPFLIDTSIAIHARDGTEAVLDNLAEHDGKVLLSSFESR